MRTIEQALIGRKIDGYEINDDRTQIKFHVGELSSVTLQVAGD